MADSPEEARDFAAMNARVYAMSPEDRKAWYYAHPLSMYEPEPAALLLDESDESDTAILRAAADILSRRYQLFTSDLQTGLRRAAEQIMLDSPRSPV
jgi:hypothetical protein